MTKSRYLKYKKLLLLVLFTLVSGCTKKDEKKTESDKPKTETTDTVKSKPTPEAVSNKNPDVRDSVSDVKYVVNDIPKSVKYTGKKLFRVEAGKIKTDLTYLLLLKRKIKKSEMKLWKENISNKKQPFQRSFTDTIT